MFLIDFVLPNAVLAPVIVSLQILKNIYTIVNKKPMLYPTAGIICLWLVAFYWFYDKKSGGYLTRPLLLIILLLLVSDIVLNALPSEKQAYVI